jgi:hypothetical protein
VRRPGFARAIRARASRRSILRQAGHQQWLQTTKTIEFVLPAIAQCGINVAASVASVYSAPKVVEALILAEKFHSSFGFDRSLLVPREFKI